jgi:branched-chain amino acid aminotransferase
MDGAMVDWDQANVHVLTHTLHYGSGMFEGIRAYGTPRGPAIFRLDDHLARLYRTASILLTEIPFSQTALRDAARNLVLDNSLTDCYIRPLVFRGFGEMGLNLAITPVRVAMIAWPWGAYLGAEGLEKGIRVTVSSWRRQDPNVMPPAAKGTGQYLNSVLAKTEAMRAGFDEALMLNLEGYVAEGSGENIFVVRDGMLLTPPESAGVLVGITRATVSQIARDLGYSVCERNLVRSDIYTADELFFCGTGAEITPIREVDNRRVGDGTPGQITKRIQETFFGAVTGKLSQYEGWLYYVD